MVERGRPTGAEALALFMPALPKNPIDGRFAHFQPESNFGNSFAVGFELPALARVARCAWASTDPSPRSRTLQSRNRPFTEPDALLLDRKSTRLNSSHL